MQVWKCSINRAFAPANSQQHSVRANESVPDMKDCLVVKSLKGTKSCYGAKFNRQLSDKECHLMIWWGCTDRQSSLLVVHIVFLRLSVLSLLRFFKVIYIWRPALFLPPGDPIHSRHIISYTPAFWGSKSKCWHHIFKPPFFPSAAAAAARARSPLT